MFSSRWWPFFVVAFYILAVLPRLMVKTLEPSHSFKDASIFFTCGMILSSFALPIVLARSVVVSVINLIKIITLIEFMIYRYYGEPVT